MVGFCVGFGNVGKCVRSKLGGVTSVGVHVTICADVGLGFNVDPVEVVVVGIKVAVKAPVGDALGSLLGSSVVNDDVFVVLCIVNMVGDTVFVVMCCCNL